MKKKDESKPNEWEIISRYTRAQAIEDGVLVDVSELASEAGFIMPVALTAAAHGYCVEVPEKVSGQDEVGRLWDVLNMLRCAIRRSNNSGTSLSFAVLVQNSDEQPAKQVELKSICGPGDAAEPVITIMLPAED